ncbi:BRO1 domain-containing protein [Baffinella frigidus]|nr:BRO1 domain-containing protein [Cryptophyta sp. CCMP2293]
MSLIMVPRKRSVAIDYPAKLGKFISTQYSPAEAAHHNEGVKALGEQRAQCLHASDPGESNRDIGMRYWAQLSLLDNRIDFNQVGMRFEWYDAFKGPTALAPSQGKCASISLNLEIASVLFNTAVLYLHAGSKEHQVGTSESFKNALGFFKKAAGMFAAVKDTASKIDGAVSKDLSADCLTMLETLSLAHAQRCFLEQAAASKKSPAILAKLAGGCANLYAEAHGPTASGGELAKHLKAHGPTASGGELAKHLKGTTLGAETELEALYFRASSHIYAAQAVEAEHKGLKKGHEVGHMVAAVQKLDAALTLAKKLDAALTPAKKVKPDRKDGVAAFLATATKALAQVRPASLN